MRGNRLARSTRRLDRSCWVFWPVSVLNVEKVFGTPFVVELSARVQWADHCRTDIAEQRAFQLRADDEISLAPIIAEEKLIHGAGHIPGEKAPDDGWLDVENVNSCRSSGR